MKNEDMSFLIFEEPGTTTCKCFIPECEEPVCKCTVHKNSNDCFQISSWFTKEGYGHRGIGRATLKKTLQNLYERFGEPVGVQYVWNGANDYVQEWLVEHFDAVCTCPIAVQKYAAEDDWSSHIYDLNKEKVVDYFSLGKKEQERGDSYEYTLE